MTPGWRIDPRLCHQIDGACATETIYAIVLLAPSLLDHDCDEQIIMSIVATARQRVASDFTYINELRHIGALLVAGNCTLGA